MKIAVPTAAGALCMHFGHCETFCIMDADTEQKNITGTAYMTPPPHEPGVLPKWLAEQGVDVIIAAGMGQRAQTLFARHGIEVVTGASAQAPETAAENWLNGTLATGANTCDH